MRSTPEPDYRFTLANERTYLAWVRTALALAAAGVAVIHFPPGSRWASYGLGLGLLVLAGVMNGAAFRAWRRNESAIRDDQPLLRSRVPRLVSTLLTLVTIGIVIVLLVEGPV